MHTIKDSKNAEEICGWIPITKSEIATVTCPAIHLIEKLSNDSKKEISILCDVEDSILC